MYEFAYNEVIQDSRQTMRARERQAMDRVIAMLRTAHEKGPGSRERVEALFYLRRLWMIFLNDLNDPNDLHAGDAESLRNEGDEEFETDMSES